MVTISNLSGTALTADNARLVHHRGLHRHIRRFGCCKNVRRGFAHFLVAIDTNIVLTITNKNSTSHYIFVDREKLVRIDSHKNCATVCVDFIALVSHGKILVDSSDINVRNVCHVWHAIFRAKT